VIRHATGVLTTEWIPGSPRRVGRLRAPDARALGDLVRRAHARVDTATGGLAGWPSRARSLRAYAGGRARDAAARTRTRSERALVDDALARVLAAPGADGMRFALLHGDLVEDNIVWPRTGPVLVDWEFWRMGDPAEDLAYLAAMNGAPDRVRDAIHDGYAAPLPLRKRADAWRSLVLADAGLWHRAHGLSGLADDLLHRAAEGLGRPA
jgi:aminoglycoside phosphotransferase (APT) family kinase protein